MKTNETLTVLLDSGQTTVVKNMSQMDLTDNLMTAIARRTKAVGGKKVSFREDHMWNLNNVVYALIEEIEEENDDV